MPLGAISFLADLARAGTGATGVGGMDSGTRFTTWSMVSGDMGPSRTVDSSPTMPGTSVVEWRVNDGGTGVLFICFQFTFSHLTFFVSSSSFYSAGPGTVVPTIVVAVPVAIAKIVSSIKGVLGVARGEGTGTPRRLRVKRRVRDSVCQDPVWPGAVTGVCGTTANG